MFFDVNDLEHRKAEFATSLAPDKISLPDPKLRITGPIEVSGTAELRPALNEIQVKGRIDGSVDSECDRCLEPLKIPVSGDFELSYRPVSLQPEDPEISLDDEEAEVGFYEGKGVELSDVVQEQILLWLPMQRVCRESCKGICPICGQNRNEKDCSCRVALVDERWAALRQL
jgi:uncharacterized protein